MFATVIQDVFKRAEAAEVRDALKMLCAPGDNYGWASSGLYCFWHPDTREIFYFGLAKDLKSRFEDHTGLRHCEATACKRVEIAKHFDQHDRLGYSIFVRSTLEQDGPMTHEVPFTEGVMIQGHKIVHGSMPAWNKMGGSKEGQDRSRETHGLYLRCFVEQDWRLPLVARRTLRQLAAEATHVEFEAWLHGARMLSVHTGLDYDKALEMQSKFQPAMRDAIENAQYRTRSLVV